MNIAAARHLLRFPSILYCIYLFWIMRQRLVSIQRTRSCAEYCMVAFYVTWRSLNFLSVFDRKTYLFAA